MQIGKKKITLKMSAAYVAKLALLTALAFALYMAKFNLPFMFPSFLEMQFSELPALLAGVLDGTRCGSAGRGVEMRHQASAHLDGVCGRAHGYAARRCIGAACRHHLPPQKGQKTRAHRHCDGHRARDSRGGAGQPLHFGAVFHRALCGRQLRRHRRDVQRHLSRGRRRTLSIPSISGSAWCRSTCCATS